MRALRRYIYKDVSSPKLNGFFCIAPVPMVGESDSKQGILTIKYNKQKPRNRVLTTGFSKSKVENPRKACERFAKGLRKVTVPCSGCSPSICIFYLPRENENLLEGGNTDLLLCICRGIRMLLPTCEVRVVGFISELFSEGGSSPPLPPPSPPASA